GEDVDVLAPLPMAWVPPGVEVKTPERWPLARGKATYVGEAVAAVVGLDKYSVVDAAEDVIVEYESLPAIVDLEEAAKDTTVIHDDFGTNTSYEWGLGG